MRPPKRRLRPQDQHQHDGKERSEGDGARRYEQPDQLLDDADDEAADYGAGRAGPETADDHGREAEA